MFIGERLEVGQGATSFGIIEATPMGLAFLGKLGELRVLAERVKEANGWDDDELAEHLPESLPPPYWASPAD